MATSSLRDEGEEEKSAKATDEEQLLKSKSQWGMMSRKPSESVDPGGEGRGK